MKRTKTRSCPLHVKKSRMDVFQTLGWGSDQHNQRRDTMYSLGIDVGYSSVKLVLLDAKNALIYRDYRLHKGRIKETLTLLLGRMLGKVDKSRIVHGALTGSGCKPLAELSGAAFVNEAACLVEGALWADGRVKSIVEIGGQGAKYITEFDAHSKNRIKISMNPNCSAGTGSFLDEQVSRLNLDIEEYSTHADKARTLPRIAGRCSVFAKTDIIHHQQEGAAVEDILLGLAYALVRNYRTAVMRRLPRDKPIMFAGGVAHNLTIRRALRDVLKLEEADIIIPPGFDTLNAAGAAIIARAEEHALDMAEVLRHAERIHEVLENEESNLPCLARFGQDDSTGKHDMVAPNGPDGSDRFFLGVDVGSTSTNVVLMNESGRIIAYQYLRTLGRPRQAVAEGLRRIGREAGESVKVAGVCTTGSGRYMIGRIIGADVVKDEITAQARAAVSLDPEIDTVFEIGGQDSKFISLDNGVVVDFQMNKICAAGTGSFLEEQAKKLGVDIDRFGETALGSVAPLNLGERCTVFIESSMAAHLSRGAALDDLIAGLCYSIVKNYLHRVVGYKRVGERIFLQGGIAFNQGVVNAFRALTGKDVRVPPFFSVTGAYGAALLAREEVGTGVSAFKGFAPSMVDDAETEQPPSLAAGSRENFDERTARLVFAGYDGVMDPKRKTIGMPRALFTYGMYPMFHVFFEELGYNVLLSEPTSEETVRLCQEYSLEETCFPVKLVNGHLAELVNRGVDYIFFPDLYTVLHPGSETRQNYGCVYMQLAFKLVNQAMELDKRGIKLLAPTIAFSLGQDFMKETFMKLGALLDRGPEQVGRAMQRGMQAFQAFERKMEENAREAARSIAPNKKTFVLISKIYGVADPVLNQGIPDKLNEMGYAVLPFYDLPEVSIFKQHPNMFWPFGQHILETARLVKEHPNLYAIFLTHHGCGPDTVFTHYFKEIMGEKPYLNIEVDEHSSGVGMLTRVEAFVNSLKKIPPAPAAAMEKYRESAVGGDTPVDIETSLARLPKGTTVWLPYLPPYADIAAELLRARTIDARVLPATDREAMDIGRGHTITNEYFSMTTLLGDVLRLLRGSGKNNGNTAIMVPQGEGAEVDCQYARLLRCKLDEEGFKNVAVVAPFLEDLLAPDTEMEAVFACLLAGDIVMAAPRPFRTALLERVRAMIRENGLDPEALVTLAEDAKRQLAGMSFSKRIFAIGEPLVLFNDFVNNHVFRKIEDAGHRVVHAPLSEYLWTFWKDYLDQNKGSDTSDRIEMLERFRSAIGRVSRALAEESPFARDPADLCVRADKTIGYYAGTFGRYREAKVLDDVSGADGVINVTSMYENTGITLSVLHRGFENNGSKPVLNLTFDGNRNENDETKVESFLYYI